MSLKSDDYYATVGLHPIHANDPFKKGNGNRDEEEKMLNVYFDQIRVRLTNLKYKDKFLAIGACGLDYEREYLADRRT